MTIAPVDFATPPRFVSPEKGRGGWKMERARKREREKRGKRKSRRRGGEEKEDSEREEEEWEGRRGANAEC